MIEESIRSYLLDQAGIAAIVSTRMHPGLLPQNSTFPAIVYKQISSSRGVHLTGAVNLITARFQFDCFSTSSQQVRSLRAQLITALHAYSGAMGSPSSVVQLSMLDSERDDYEADTKLFNRSLDVIISYEE